MASASTVPDNGSSNATAPSLAVQLGRLQLRNPILTASGTFGYAREMASLVDFSQLGGILPKTVTQQPRAGNTPWRTVETTAGLLNAIGLDNDGIETFIAHHMPYLGSLPTAIIVSIAGSNHDEFVSMAARLSDVEGIAAVELNISCPNVAHGIDFGADATMCEKLVAACRAATRHPILAKLTPNVTRIADIAKGATSGGADALSLINTVQGMAIDWRKQKPDARQRHGRPQRPGHQAACALLRAIRSPASGRTPIIGIGGIATIDDVMEFLVAGAPRFKSAPRTSTIQAVP
jgi:dihydroorotate dehydrogenase (NAD+) catalytic subunit